MQRNPLSIAYLTFICLGLHDGLLGVVWPSMRRTFEVSLESAGLLLAALVVGFTLSGVSSGRLTGRLGAGRFLLIGSAVRATGSLAIALSPSWWAVLAAMFVVGLGGGVLDAGLNTYMATNHRPSQMNWLHASYGVGSTLSPLLVTTILVAGRPWAWSYAAVGALQLLMSAAFLLTQAAWQRGPAVEADGQPVADQAGSRETLGLIVVWISVFLFLFITGIEVTAGQWAYTLFTEGRAVALRTAGLWVSIYWGSFTVGRILLGFVADRVPPVALLRAAMLGATVSAGLIWWNRVNGVGFAGLALLGFCLAPLYPFMVSLTPDRLGRRHAANAIGFQVSGGSIGAASLPGLAGILAGRVGLEVIGPFLLAACAVQFVLHEGVIRASRRLPSG